MAELIPLEPNPDMLKSGVDAFVRLSPALALADQGDLERIVRTIWSACAVAHDRQGREAAIRAVLREEQ